VNTIASKGVNVKVGIMTFHWGTNYGGVLQAYALQQFLIKHEIDASIINYKKITHKNSIIRCFKAKSFNRIMKNIDEYKQERKFIPFRKKYLNLTEAFFNIEDVKKGTKNIDVYICGSDQIWNPYIALSYGFPYFLPFETGHRKKISYAVSLGCEVYPKAIFKKVAPYIKQFDSISVREKTAVKNLQDNGITDVALMPDPVLLLDQEDFNKIAVACHPDINKKNYCFFYVLQENQYTIKKIKENLKDKICLLEASGNRQHLAVEEWVSAIANSEFVITNSFHGVVFSLLYHKNFIVIPIEGPLDGMNDRIHTLLSYFDLNDFVLNLYDNDSIDRLLNKRIDWVKVEMVRKSLVEKATNYLIGKINENSI